MCDVCIIDRDVTDAKATQDTLASAGYDCIIAHCAREGWKAIEETSPRVVICERRLPDEDGIEFCARLRESPDLEGMFFIIVNEPGDSAVNLDGIDSGIDDYLSKPIDPVYLLARVRVGMRMSEVNERLRKAAITDGLTDLYNHDYLNCIIEREVKRARRYGGRLSLIMIDLDFFKAINDTYGHLVGNDTLVQVARVLKDNVRDVDAVGRFGGEEFAIVTTEATLEDAVNISERIRHGITDTINTNIEVLADHRVTASFGIATADDARVRSAADLVDLADKALYAAKSAGRNRVCTAFDVTDDALPVIEGKEVEGLRKQVAILSVQAKEVYVQTVSSLLQALEEKDPFTARHSLNVAYYGEHTARTMGLNEPLSVSIKNAGLLHDIGKVGIPDRILMKPTKLTAVEEMVMRQVPAISVRIIDYLRILESEMHIIRHQGEYFDGSGYPDGLRGEQIPIGSRVLLVANAFDAMTTDRVYRACRSIDEAYEEIEANSGRQFDPKVVCALKRFMEEHREDVLERVQISIDSLRVSAATL